MEQNSPYSLPSRIHTLQVLTEMALCPYPSLLPSFEKVIILWQAFTSVPMETGTKEPKMG